MIARLVVFAAIVALALFVARATPLGERIFSEHGLDDLAATAWAAPALVALYTVTFGLGLPGSALFCAAGFVFAPPVAALLGMLGGTLGSSVAFGTGRFLGAEARARWRAHPGYALVERSLDFTGLLALRLFPALPHSLVNYGSGVAGARLADFVPATLIGTATKSYVYASVTHRLARAPGFADLLSWDAWGLLVGLAAAAAIAKAVLRRRDAAAPSRSP